MQGVGYRFFTRRLATKMGIRGFVRNKPDGTVEIEAEAEDSVMESFLSELYKGPPSSEVSEIDTEQLSGGGKYKGFDVRF